MSISPINHYALTTAQPGVINEEAYTVLDLVGKCGSKVNECVNAVNEALDEIEDYDARITAAQETADGAASTASAALTTATENGQRITNVSAVALEARSVAFSAQAEAEAANANAQYAKRYVDNVTMFQGVLWWNDAIVVSGLLTTGFAQFLCNVVAQILNGSGKYYDLTSIGPGSACNILKIKGYCATSQIEYGHGCVGLVDIELDIYKPVSELERAAILVHYKQHLASEAQATAEGSVFDVTTTITLPAEEYNASNQYDSQEFFCNRLCTYNEYVFQL